MSVRSAKANPPVRRWQKLPEGSQRILTAAALHAGDLPDARLAELAANPADVDPLVEGEWLRESKPGHWRVGFEAGAVALLAPWSQRRAAHLALARMLERAPAHGPQAAAHFEAAGQPGEAGRVWLAVARMHCRRHQHKLAAHGFTEAIRLLPEDTPEAELVAAMGDFGVCVSLQRDSKPAIELLQTWRERAEWAILPAFQGEAARLLAGLYIRDGRHVEGAEIHRRAAGHFLQAGRGADAASEWLAAAGTLVWALHFSAAREAATAAVDQARACRRPDLESQALAVEGLTLGMLGETVQGRAALDAALSVALANRLTAQAADAYRLMGNVDDYASCYDDQSAFRKTLTYCARHDHTIVADLCRGCLSYSLYRGGRWAESLRLARQVAEKKDAPEDSRAAGTTVHGMLRVMRGEMRPGLALLEQGLQLGRRSGIGSIEIHVWSTRAAAHEMSGRPAEAAVCYRRLLDYWRTTEDRHDALSGFCAAVTFFCAQGDRAQAAEFAVPLQSIAAVTSNPEALGAAHLAAAELQLLDQEAAEAVAAFRQALAAFDGQNCCLESIRIRLRLAAALHATGDAKQAASVLREARSRAVRLGCRPLAALARQALARTATRSATGLEALLSVRQREVARHLSAGRTNKEIAAALGLSVRTVDMHVAHLFARLDCRTRTEAAAKLASLAAN